jgi:glutamate/tyrosine decarboxylase-like PLP-dependent enzyme
MIDSKLAIPSKGMDREDVLSRMQEARRDDANYADGKTWSLVYYLGEEHSQFINQAHNMFSSTNGLNPMAFKSLMKMEAEVVRMSANLFHGDAQTVGVMTSGGTESILMAVKAYRDYARKKRPWILRPEIIMPSSAHVAFDKAGYYLGVKIVPAPLKDDLTVDVKAVKRLINHRTIALVGSAPGYPHGVIDPIVELGELALKKKLPLHVDGCLGGFLLPFVEKLGYPIPPFDFRVPGVTSISADIHKYGYAAKGASVILYRSMDYLKHQFFVQANWSGGIYASPSFAGTRPGGPIAAAWAALHAIGEDGYLAHAKDIMDIVGKLKQGVNAIPGLRVLGNPQMSVFAYNSTDPDVDIFAVSDQMTAKGWHIDRQQNPMALHVMVTPAHAQSYQAYLKDLAEAVAHVRAHPELSSEGSAPMYGMIAKMPFRGMVKQSVLKIMEGMYGPEAKIPDLGNDEPDMATKIGASFIKLKDKFDAKTSEIKDKTRSILR